MQNQVRVAVVQAGSVLFNKTASIEKAVSLAFSASEQGAKIVLFPESFIPGHPRLISKMLKREGAAATASYLKELYLQNSLTENDPALAPLSQAAAQAGIYLAVGVTERLSDALFYCSLFFWNPQGELLGKDRKIKMTGPEALIWSQGNFNKLTVWDTAYGKTGTILSGENYLPLMRAAMYARGVRLYMAPTSESEQLWQCSIRHIAAEGQCFVLSCNQYLDPAALPDEFKGEETEEIPACQGGSAIIGPRGEYLAGPLFGREGILIADLNLDQLEDVRREFDPKGAFRLQ